MEKQQADRQLLLFIVRPVVKVGLEIMMICEGDVWESVCKAVNVGYGTDTVPCNLHRFLI